MPSHSLPCLTLSSHLLVGLTRSMVIVNIKDQINLCEFPLGKFQLQSKSPNDMLGNYQREADRERERVRWREREEDEREQLTVLTR